MKKIFILFGIMILFEVIPFSPAKAESVSLGMITGGQYLKDNDNDRVAYLIGLIDGISIEAFKAANKAETPWLAKCLEDVEIAQVKAIFEKRLNTGSENLRRPAALVFRDEMEKFCEKRK